MSARGRLAAALLATGVATAALAGGPLYTFDYENRTPYAWNMASWPNGKVPVYTDLGRLGPLSNARADELVAYAAAQWSGVPTTSFRAAVAGDFSARGLGDVDGEDVFEVLGEWNGGGIDVIYDDNGSVLEGIFGIPATGVLGITNLDYTNVGTPEILEAWIILSGPGIRAEDPTGLGFGGVVTHEFGHAINLAHSQANGALENFSTLDASGPSGCPTPWTGTVKPWHVETMYPISTPAPGASGEYMATVDLIDDIAAVSDIYPAPGYPANRTTIRGEIRDASGNPVTGVNVIARNVNDPFADASSYISGQLSKGQAGPDGSFVLNGLTGASYVVYVDNLMIGAFSVPRFVALPGPEEYYNGGTESGDGATDKRCAWSTITGSTVPQTANITFNRMPGAPELIQAPDVGVAHDMTPDGRIVVGTFAQNAPAFRWDLETGEYENIGGLVSSAVSISDDGSKIVSNIDDEADGILKPAIYENGSWTPLPTLPGAVPCDNNADLGPSYGTAFDISGDGSTVVGLSYGAAGCFGGTTRGFKWTQAGGIVQLPKLDTFDRPNRASAVNYDGTVIVGWDEASTGARRGTQWRNGVASMIRKGTNPVGEGLDVSRDGQWVVGAINFATASQAWRYRPSTGVEQLGFLPGQTGGVTNALSDDASVITGFSSSLTTGNLSPAIWTSGLGFVDLNMLFASQGLNTEGGLVASGTAVSSNGQTIAGHILSQFGYVPFALKIPTVVMCHGQETVTVDFPHGMDAALFAGDTLGACQCNTAAPAGTIALTIDKPSPGTSRTSWSEVTGASGYDVVRGGLKWLRRYSGDFRGAANACLENDVTSTSRDDSDTPARGDGFWYLVGATTCGGRSTYDSDAPTQVGSRDAGIAASVYACP